MASRSHLNLEINIFIFRSNHIMGISVITLRPPCLNYNPQQSQCSMAQRCGTHQKATSLRREIHDLIADPTRNLVSSKAAVFLKLLFSFEIDIRTDTLSLPHPYLSHCGEMNLSFVGSLRKLTNETRRCQPGGKRTKKSFQFGKFIMSSPHTKDLQCKARCGSPCFIAAFHGGIRHGKSRSGSGSTSRTTRLKAWGFSASQCPATGRMAC